MKIQEIYNLAIKMGKESDFRGFEGVEKVLNRKRKKFETLPEEQKSKFDQTHSIDGNNFPGCTCRRYCGH